MTKKDLCPQCGTLLNAASTLEGRFTPKPGDVTVCAYCSTFLKFDEFMFLRILPDEEFEKLEKVEKEQLNAVRKLIVQKQMRAPNTKLTQA